MRVSRNYVDSLTVDQLRYLADFDAQMVCHPSVAGLGTIMEPAIQGPEYKPVYGYVPSPVGLLTDDNYGPENDEYTEAFVERYGRMPREHNENLVFVGNPENPIKRERSRLGVMSDRDYEIWCNNQVAMNTTPLVLNKGTEHEFTIDRAKLARLGPYRVEYGADGAEMKMGLNPLSLSTARCSFCGTLINLDEEADKCQGIPKYKMEYEQDHHFCSMKCRMAFKEAHNLTPEQMRIMTTAIPGRDAGAAIPTNRSDMRYTRTNY